MTRKGFTLVELLLVVVLIPLIASVIYLNFSSGVRIWRALNSGVVEEDTQLFFQKISRDFQSSFRYSEIPFVGEAHEVTFAAFIDTDPSLGGDRGFGQVGYFYDTGKKAILRQERNRHELFKEKPGRIQEALRNVYAFKVSYFTYDKAEKVFKWQESWPPEEKTLPIALRLEFESRALGETRYLTRTFELPAGG